VVEIPNFPSLRSRLDRRLFGGAAGAVFRGMFTLTLGSGIGRIIGIAAIPVLTRLYSPESFGVLAVFTAVVTIITPLVTLRYVLALPLPRHDGVAMNLLALSLGLMLVLTGFLALALWLWSIPLFKLVSMEVLAPWWWLIALGVLGTAVYELLSMWATRKRNYKLIAQTTVSQSAAGTLVKIGLGLIGLQALGLIIGQVMAQTSGVGRFVKGFWPTLRSTWRHVHFGRMRKVAWRHRGFPAWRVPSQFLMAFSMQLPTLFMATVYDAETTGQFSLAVMALTVPVNLIGKSAGSALYGEASSAIKTNRFLVLRMCKETQIRLLLLSIAPTILVFFGGPYIFGLLFGDRWIEAGLYASLLSIGLMFQFTSAPLIQVMNLLSKQSSFLQINFIRLSGLLVTFCSAYFLSLQPTTTVLVLSLYSAAFYIGVSLFVLNAVSESVK